MNKREGIILAFSVIVIWVAVLVLLRPTIATSENIPVWDMNTLVSAHSLVDWQTRTDGEVWLDAQDIEPCKQGEYGLWCSFEDATTKERFWLGPYVSDLGEIIIVDSFCVQNHTSVTYEMVAMMNNGAEWLNLANDVFVPRYKWICISFPIPLQSGDRLGAWFRGATSTDDLRVNILWHTVARR